jgi:hypothetical protein
MPCPRDPFEKKSSFKDAIQSVSALHNWATPSNLKKNSLLQSSSPVNTPFHAPESPSKELSFLHYNSIFRAIDSRVDERLIDKFRLVFLGVVRLSYMKQVFN